MCEATVCNSVCSVMNNYEKKGNEWVISCVAFAVKSVSTLQELAIYSTSTSSSSFLFCFFHLHWISKGKPLLRRTFYMHEKRAHTTFYPIVNAYAFLFICLLICHCGSFGSGFSCHSLKVKCQLFSVKIDFFLQQRRTDSKRLGRVIFVNWCKIFGQFWHLYSLDFPRLFVSMHKHTHTLTHTHFITSCFYSCCSFWYCQWHNSHIKVALYILNANSPTCKYTHLLHTNLIVSHFVARIQYLNVIEHTQTHTRQTHTQNSLGVRRERVRSTHRISFFFNITWICQFWQTNKIRALAYCSANKKYVDEQQSDAAVSSLRVAQWNDDDDDKPGTKKWISKKKISQEKERERERTTKRQNIGVLLLVILFTTLAPNKCITNSKEKAEKLSMEIGVHRLRKEKSALFERGFSLEYRIFA